MIIKSKIIPLPQKDIDTDLIIPADYLKGTGKEGLGEFLFKRLRDEDADFPFNLKKYQDAQILVAGDNFGCGSSREHAAWALKDWGIKVIIAPSFSDIFHSNTFKNGLLPVALAESAVEELCNLEELEVDLENQKVSAGDFTYDFQIDPYRKHCLLNDMNDLDYLLSNLDEIKAFEKDHAKNLFFNVAKV